VIDTILSNDVFLESKQGGNVTNEELKEVSELVDKIQIIRGDLEKQEKDLKYTEECLRKLEEIDLPNKFAQIGLSELKMENGNKISVKPYYRGHISKDNRDRAFEWLRENNYGDLIKNEVKATFGKGEDKSANETKEFLEKNGFSFSDREAVHPQSLSAFIREQTERGKALPHDLLGVYIGQKATIKRGER
jgi:hypothetical protein